MKNQERIRLLLLILLLEASVFLTLDTGRQLEATRAAKTFFQRKALKPADSFIVLNRFSFENQESLKDWEEKVFKGKTVYQVLAEENEGFLNSSSRNASSGLFIKTRHDVSPDLHLSWKWKAITFPVKKEPQRLSNRTEDDFAARVYLIFPGSNFFNSNVIEYIWDEYIPAGSMASSPYSERVKLFVIRSGKIAEEEAGWRVEERNIYEDYIKLFGRKPERPLGILALMSDSDNTATQSESDFGEIVLKRKNQTKEVEK